MAAVGAASSGTMYNQAGRMRTWRRVRVHADAPPSVGRARSCTPGAAGAELMRPHELNAAAHSLHALFFSFLLCFTHGQEVMSVPVTWETETVAKIP